MKIKHLAIRSASAAALVSCTLAAGLPAPAVAQTTPGEVISTKVPLEQLAALPAMSNLRLSPDGTKIAAQLGSGNDFVYAIIDLQDGGKATPIASAGTFKETGQRSVFGYEWFDDRYLLMTLASRENVYGTRADIYRLVAFDTTSGKLHDVGWDDAMADASNVLYRDKENKRILLARQANRRGDTERMFLYQVDWVDVATGKVLSTEQRKNPIVNGWVADSDGVVRMGVAYDRNSGEQRYLYRSRENENFRTVARVTDEHFTGSGIQPLVFLDEPDMAIVRSNHEGYDAIYKANLSNMEIVEKLFSIDGYDVSGVIPNAEDNGILGYTYATDRQYREYTDPRFAQIQEFLREEFGKGNAQIVSTNDAETRMIVALSRPAQLPSYYLYDVESGSFNLISYTHSELKDGVLNPVEMVRYTASDGLEMEAVVTKPRLRSQQKDLPVVVLTHGGPYGVRDYASYDQWAQAIAEQGYVVVQPNYRGSGGYGAEFVKAGRSDGFGTRMQDDLNDVVDYLDAQGLVDKDRACMMGWSYGGYASARAAQRDPQRWDCTIAGAGVYDLPRMKQYDLTYLGEFGANYLAEGASALADVSPARNAGGTWSPILIVHGVRDPRVPIEQARILRGALQGAGKQEGVDFAYLEQPKNGHYGAFFTKEERLEWLGGASAWLAKHNPSYIPSDPDYEDRPPLDPAAKKMGERLGIEDL
ncbi:alpha/beta hydrolase family protein [Pelagerythrobacter rhizovicinus]|nr:alpha/beta fold hydrolase [Pelagerythrobacter rhizovicinus]